MKWSRVARVILSRHKPHVDHRHVIDMISECSKQRIICKHLSDVLLLWYIWVRMESGTRVKFSKEIGNFEDKYTFAIMTQLTDYQENLIMSLLYKTRYYLIFSCNINPFIHFISGNFQSIRSVWWGSHSGNKSGNFTEGQRWSASFRGIRVWAILSLWCKYRH